MKTTFTAVILSVMLLCVCSVHAQPFRTPTFTGNAATNFKTDEKNAAAGVAYCFTWDTAYMYFGVTGPGAYIKTEPSLIYIDSDPNATPRAGTGDSIGFNYDNRVASLPFSANFVLYFKDGYAEARTSTGAGTWSTQTTYTSNIVTGTNDIEIRVPWSILPGGVRPAGLNILFFKTNGNGSQADAYEVKPGVNNVDNSYSSDVAVNGLQLFYRIQSTGNAFYNANNMFTTIDNFAANYCKASTSTSTTNITTTSAKFNWTAVPGAFRYQLFGRKGATGAWINAYLPGNKTSYTATGLLCNTNYQWMIRTNCDTTQAADINSLFTAIKTFKTSACAALQDGGASANSLLVSPSPVRKGGYITLKTAQQIPNAVYSIYSVAGVLLQEGKITGAPVSLGNRINSGVYLLVVSGGNQVLRSQLQVTE